MGTQQTNALVTAAAALSLLLPLETAAAFSIELKGAAPHRIERQRAYTLQPAEKADVEPATKDIATRLTELGVKLGAQAFIRIFKSESQLELWLRKDDRFVLFETFPICFWSGKLGPKIKEGDEQSPEGFYTITRRQLHWSARWARSFNIGFPNKLDRRNGRTGSYILIHGGCSSIGCYSMTNRQMSRIHYLIRAAIRHRQKHVPVHIFPFRMTEENLARHQASQWALFWRDLKAGYDVFERTRKPPDIGICGKRYLVRPAPSNISTSVRLLDGHARRSPKPSAETWACPQNTAETKSQPEEHVGKARKSL